MHQILSLIFTAKIKCPTMFKAPERLCQEKDMRMKKLDALRDNVLVLCVQ